MFAYLRNLVFAVWAFFSGPRNGQWSAEEGWRRTDGRHGWLTPYREAVTRADGWENPVTGLGTIARDKTMQAAYQPDFRLADQELSDLFYGNDLAERIVAKKPREMMRCGYELKLSGDIEDDDLDQTLQAYGRRLALDSKVLEWMTLGRAFGGAALIVGAMDGGTMDTPLNEDAIQSIDFLTALDRRWVVPVTWDTDPASPEFGKPLIYQVMNPLGGAMVWVHRSRLLRFEGSIIDPIKRRQYQGWSFSVLARPYHVLRKFEMTFDSAAALVADMSQAVMKIKGLFNILTSNEKDTLITRMQLMDMSRSVARMVMIDADGEEFERRPTSVSGLPDLMDRFILRLSAATEMPATVLMGMSPAGLNATGESDIRLWYDTIAAAQEAELAPVLERLYGLITLAADSGVDADPEALEVCFKPLWEPTDTEQATLEKTIADRDVAYINAGVLHPEEVALSRFADGKFSMGTTIDVKSREEELQHTIDLSTATAEAKATAGPPDPNAPPPAPPGQPPKAEPPPAPAAK